MRFYFQVHLLDPLIISENPSSTNPKSLDYLPGSSILGCVAAKLYPQLAADDAWQLFQSGAVRFGPCYPVVNGQMSLPVPASWHYPKGSEPTHRNTQGQTQYQADVVCNHSQGGIDPSVQYQQCRSGFIDSQGIAAQVEFGQTTKTALERDTGGVKKSALFNYQYLQAGQTFIGWIECQNEAQQQQLEQALYGEQRLGHARSHEFGRVQIQPLTITEPSLPSVGTELTLWCVSDLQCINALGLPSLSPSLAELVSGAQGQLDFSRSFIRQTRRQVFNQKRGGLDSEQVCIAKGSVLVFTKVSITPMQVEQLARQGVGLNRQQGLGWVIVEPTWMQGFRQAQWFAPLQSQGLLDPETLVTPQAVTQTKGLLAWLDSQLAQAQREKDAAQQAQVIIDGLLNAYQQLRAYNRVPENYQAGASSSQWARIMTLLRSGDANWQAQLFADFANPKSVAICKTVNDDSGWGIEWQTTSGYITLSEYCQTLFAPQSSTALLKALERLSRYDISTKQGLSAARAQIMSKEAQA